MSACFLHMLMMHLPYSTTHTHTHTHTLQQQNQLTLCSALTARGNDWNCCQLTYPLNHMLVGHVRVNSNESLQHAELVGLVD